MAASSSVGASDAAPKRPATSTLAAASSRARQASPKSNRAFASRSAFFDRRMVSQMPSCMHSAASSSRAA